jgi:hypothetical protein
MRSVPNRAAALAALLFASVSGLARAEMEGIKIGEGRLHAFVNLELRYDTFATVSATGNILGDGSFVVQPGLTLNVPGTTLALALDAEVAELLYFTYTGLNRFLADGHLSLDFLHGGPFELQLNDTFIRANNTSLSVLPYAIISDYNDASAKASIRPGGGALIIEPGYHFIYNHFESFAGAVPPNCPQQSPGCDPNTAGFLDYYLQRILFDTRLKFLPKTSAILNAEFDVVNYINQGVTPGQPNANAPTDLISVTLGAAGLITTRIEAALKVGYAQTILSGTAYMAIPALKPIGDQHTVVGQALVGYLFGDTGSVRLGYVRSLQAIPTTLSYDTDNHFYLSSKILLAGRLTLHLNVSYDLLEYPLNLEGMPGRQDQIFIIDVGPEYEITRWFRVGLVYNLTSDGSSDTQAFGVYQNSKPLFGAAGYVNNEFYVKLTFVY